MGKRYYCDFCDRSFADTGVNRKNHFKGVQHQRLKKQHYDAFRDPASILAEESTKIPCTRFQTGSCDFGDSCKFSHMTPERLHHLQELVSKQRQKSEKDINFNKDLKEPTLEEWLEKRSKRLRKTENNEEETEELHYELPPFLNISNLPPSLLPPSAEELRNTAKCEWG
ncbi:zinc finger matrin-type protein 5-like [Dreissena polymorpha]|uniref:Zinc finger matrin-type protein 5 n=1 Tax=Dreissena polymorpha TaxID=45954 RepID=A0A9D4N0Y3_DREPO|nr:zinc finger matrin-type protein 5-like [Dreissena polymorpha]KAH3885790.1 hypothetical protein DPMN_009788 [Dreissena polymorpha]